MGTEASYRYVRQGTDLWDDLHAGRLTTGCLTGALGFQEAGVNKALGMNARHGSHGPLMGAYYRLLQAPFHPRHELGPEQEEEANQSAVAAYNAMLDALKARMDDGQSDDGEERPAVTDSKDEADEEKAKGKAKKEKGKKKKKKKGGRTGGRLSSGDVGMVVDHSTPWSARRDMHSRMAAKRGEQGVRMAWGSAQEAGTIATLMLHYPDSIAEEVGLCMVDRASLPQEWNIGALPPIGASPDGILLLPKSFEPRFESDGKGRRRGASSFSESSAVEEATSDGEEGDKEKGKMHEESIVLNSYFIFVGGVPHFVDEGELRNTFSEWGEVKTCRLVRPRPWRGKSESKPTKKSNHLGYGFVRFASIETAAHLRALGNLTTANGLNLDIRPVKGKNDDAGDKVKVKDRDDGSEEQFDRFIVEVKNSSPFRAGGPMGKPGRFVVSDRDPYDSPPAYHMPQLQMEMLAAGTQAGLLAMQSATRGVRVFRIERDDDYIRAMLSILSEFYTRYVLEGIEPPERMFAHRKDHQELIAATIRIARSAVIWDHIPKHLMLPGEEYDLRPFVTAQASK